MQTILRSKVAPFMPRLLVVRPSKTHPAGTSSKYTLLPSRRTATTLVKPTPLLPYSTVIYHGQAPSSPEYKFEASQVFGSEVKVNPSQSEANVAADRGEIDPLPMGMHHTILLDAGGASVYMRPTDSEEAVHADRYMDDPLRRNVGGYC